MLASKQGEFIAVQRVNNWGYVTYRVTTMGEDGPIEAQIDGSKIDGPMGVSVLWPDASVTIESVVKLPHSEQVSDHGPTYTTRSTVLAVSAMLRGHRVLIPFEELRYLTLSFGEGR